ncbi:MAG: phytoene desaturase family protein [Elusimicrobiota bacterium]
MTDKKIVIVGGGPGGLTSGMILAHRGMDVEIFEKENRPGGRNRDIQLGDFKFDTGPTFLMMKYVLEEMFRETGREVSNYIELIKLDPFYRLQFPDKRFFPSGDMEKMKENIAKVFPGDEEGFEKFMKKEGKRFKSLIPCLQKAYSSLTDFIDPIFLKAIPQLSLNRTLYENLGRYFDAEELKMAFTFQAKYLGMSPWDCPALFTILSYMEYKYNIYHVTGGLNEISKAMSKIVKEEGGKINYNSKVEKILTSGKDVTGIELESGEQIKADEVILNADFGYAVNNLLPAEKLKKWSPEKLKKKKFSCGTFMLYMGLDKKYDSVNHHNIIFADDYRRNVEVMFNEYQLIDDFSFYIQNPSVTDPTLAPEGKSALYVLVPVPNKKSKINWDTEAEKFRSKVIEKIKEKTEMEDIEDHIEVEKILTPEDWNKDYNVYNGSVFNLAHNIRQMLYFRPHNTFEELNNLYLTGGGTHPGSGLPIIYESGRISANLISEKYGLPYEKPTFNPEEILGDA